MKPIIFRPDDKTVSVPSIPGQFCGTSFRANYSSYVLPARQRLDANLSQCVGLRPSQTPKGQLELNPYFGPEHQASLFKRLTGFDGPAQAARHAKGKNDPLQQVRWLINHEDASVHPLQAMLLLALITEQKLDRHHPLLSPWFFPVNDIGNGIVLMECHTNGKHWRITTSKLNAQHLFKPGCRNVALLKRVSELDEDPDYEPDTRLKELV